MAWMAPIGAAAHQKHEEVELLRKLKEADPDGKYEFKIIRAGINGFRSQDYLNQVLDSEMQGSWELAEKIDNARIILRRTIHSRTKDVHLDPDYDPYRVNYGTGSVNIVAVLLGLSVLVGVMFLFGYLNMERDTAMAGDGSATPMIMLAIGVFLLVLLVIVKIKRK